MPNLRSKCDRSCQAWGADAKTRTPEHTTDRLPLANPGTNRRFRDNLIPRVDAWTDCRRAKHLEATWQTNAKKAQCCNEIADGCLTDPEPGMDSRQATVRNMRSKCRCSCVLQFTFRRAVSCVLHRPPSQVIHCTVLYLKQFISRGNKQQKIHAHVSYNPMTGLGHLLNSDWQAKAL